MVDAAKIAKLRAKAMSTAYPEEAKAFERKAGDLMAEHGISEQAVQRALAAIFGGRANTPPSTTAGASASQPAESGSMVEAVIWLFEEEDAHRGARPVHESRPNPLGDRRIEARDRPKLRARCPRPLPPAA